MALKEAIEMAEEELRVIKRQRKVVDVIESNEPLTVIVVYEGGERSTWSGLIAVHLRRALLDLPEPF